MKKLLLLPFLLSLTLSAAELGSKLPGITLDGDKGGRVAGGKWESSELQGKVHLVFYVDPDESDLNEVLSDAVKASEPDRSKFASVAIINMAATWKPNFAIQSVLEGKQEKFPHTTYVKDMDKYIVKSWNIADDNNDIILLDKTGKILFIQEGEVDADGIKKVLKLIKENM